MRAKVLQIFPQSVCMQLKFSTNEMLVMRFQPKQEADWRLFPEQLLGLLQAQPLPVLCHHLHTSQESFLFACTKWKPWRRFESKCQFLYCILGATNWITWYLEVSNPPYSISVYITCAAWNLKGYSHEMKLTKDGYIPNVQHFSYFWGFMFK